MNDVPLDLLYWLMSETPSSNKPTLIISLYPPTWLYLPHSLILNMIRVTDEFDHFKLPYMYDEYHMAARFQIIKMPQVSKHFIHGLITANFVCERQIEVIIIASYMVRTILGMGSANKRRLYIVTSSLIGRVLNHNNPCKWNR